MKALSPKAEQTRRPSKVELEAHVARALAALKAAQKSGLLGRYLGSEECK